MQVIIPRVPNTATKNEVRDLIESVLAKKLRIPFTATPEVARCRILSIEASNGERDHHGLVTIQPDTAAKWLISHFKGASLRKKRVFAREYVVRNSDSRAFDASSDRRRVDLQIKTVEGPKVQVEGMKQFVAEHH